MSEAPDPGPLRLYLIRHAETAWSKSKRHTGTTDLPLTPTGEARAAELAPWLAPIAFTAVLVSPRQRARRTCELAGLAAAARVEPDLAEWDYGQYEGELTTDILQSRPGWALYRDGCPGGEAPWQIHDRADRLIARLLTLRGPVALFSHAQFGCALAVRWIGLEIIQGCHLALAPGSVSVLGFSADHPGDHVIEHWNGGPVQSPGAL